MGLNTPSSRNDNQLNLDSASLQLSEANFREYVQGKYPELLLEKIYIAPEHEWVSVWENRPSHRIMIKALFRSKKLTDITAEVQESIQIHVEQNKGKTQEDILKGLQKSLAYSWYKALDEKELKYNSALLKQDLINDKKQWLFDNNLTIEDIHIDREWRENYTYHITLHDKITSSSGTDHWTDIEQALAKALKELHRVIEVNETYSAKLRKEQPEFMYVRTQYEDIIKQRGYEIYNRSHNNENEYVVELAIQWKRSVSSHAVGESWEDAFINAVEDITPSEENEGGKNKGVLDVTNLSAESIVEILDKDWNTRHEVYDNLIFDEISRQLNSWSEVTFSKQQLIKYKKECIEAEHYELAAKAAKYLEKVSN